MLKFIFINKKGSGAGARKGAGAKKGAGAGAGKEAGARAEAGAGAGGDKEAPPMALSTGPNGPLPVTDGQL